MNTPNKLTITRIILAPLFLAILLWESLPYNYLLANIIFLIASITDAIDGNLARKNNQVTNFGKFVDPLADKMLVTSALLGLMQLGLCSVWIPMVIITREFIVTSVRLVASKEGKVIAANGWGKVKTIVQLVSIMIVITLKQLSAIQALPATFPLNEFSQVILTISAIITAISGIQYVWTYREYINTKE